MIQRYNIGSGNQIINIQKPKKNIQIISSKKQRKYIRSANSSEQRSQKETLKTIRSHSSLNKQNKISMSMSQRNFKLARKQIRNDQYYGNKQD